MNTLKRPWIVPAMVLFFLALIWAVLYDFIDIPYDYASHWVSSRVVSAGYYQTPPMVAWLLAVLTGIFGSSIASLKCISIAVSLVIYGIAWWTAKVWYGSRAAIVFLLLLVCTPYFFVSGLIVQTDQPILLFWLLGLLVLKKYLISERSIYLVLLSVVIGLGILSRYNYLLFPLALFVWLWLRERKLFLVSIKPVLLVVPALVLCIPNMWWNAENNWSGFLFVTDDFLHSGVASFGKIAQRILAVCLVFGVFVYTPLLWLVPSFRITTKTDAGWRKLNDDSFLVLLSAVVFVSLLPPLGSDTFFDMKWFNLLFLTAFLFLAGRIAGVGMRRIRRSFVLSASVTSCIVVIVLGLIYGQYLFGVATQTKILQVLGSRYIAPQVVSALRANLEDMPEYLLTKNSGLGAQLSVYLPSQPLSRSYENSRTNLGNLSEEITNKKTLLLCVPTDCSTLRDFIETTGKPMRFLQNVKVPIPPGRYELQYSLYVSDS